MKKPAKLVLLDAHAILHRGYHALPDFANAAGEPTGGLYGLAVMLIKIIADLKPDYIVACYDRAEATFRKKVYDQYKAGRAKADDALVKQMQSSRELFTAFNIPIYDKPGFEADDIIGTISTEMREQKDFQTIIASGDMDTLQLVRGEQVVVYTLKKGINDTIIYNEEKVKERFGFGPELLPDWKGLRGDPSDNIIGIAGIGEKTATTLITNFGSIEEIYKKLKKDKQQFKEAGLTDRIVKLLEEGEEEALFSKTLATIRCDVPIEFKLSEQKWREACELEKIDELFKRLEFRTMGARLRAVLDGASAAKPAAAEEPEPEALSPELALAVWVVDSDLTNPTTEDLVRLGGQEKVMAEIKQNNLERVYREIELPLIPILKQAKERGILVDADYLKKLSTEYHKQLSAIEDKIYAAVGEKFNLNSPKQLGEMLFDKLQLTAKGMKKTAGGARSTKESELLKLKDSHPVIADILDYRELQKLLSTYIDVLPAALDANNRLHSHLKQAGASTGRMSSDSPNLQNIPASSTHGTALRRAFLPTPGYAWAAFDYSQIEMRVLAYLSGDPELTRIFRAGEDVHSSVAQRVFGVTADQVTKDMRRKAKVINFGIVYGMGVTALRANLGTTRDEAQKFHDDYFAAFPKIRDYFEDVKLYAAKHGYTETVYGRRRHFAGIKSRLPFVRAMNERMAMNAPLQGTAADIVKIAMRQVDELLKQKGWENDAHLLLQVHDELIYEVKEEKRGEIMPAIRQAMEQIPGFDFPLVVNEASGPNWAEAK
jgi:DNA polymerase-1